MNFRRVSGTHLGISLDETTTRADVETIWRAFAGEGARLAVRDLEHAPEAIPAALARTTPFLAHPIFNRHHSETEMLRYLRELSDKDLALDRTMIPLGSCTMKLNATSEMLPVSWPEFAHLHPFAPAEQTGGYREMMASSRRAWSPPPVTPPSRCSPTPAPRASTRDCSSSRPSTRPAAKRTATSA